MRKGKDVPARLIFYLLATFLLILHSCPTAADIPEEYISESTTTWPWNRWQYDDYSLSDVGYGLGLDVGVGGNPSIVITHPKQNELVSHQVGLTIRWTIGNFGHLNVSQHYVNVTAICIPTWSSNEVLHQLEFPSLFRPLEAYGTTMIPADEMAECLLDVVEITIQVCEDPDPSRELPGRVLSTKKLKVSVTGELLAKVYLSTSTISFICSAIVVVLYLRFSPLQRFPSNIVFLRSVVDLIFSLQTLFMSSMQLANGGTRVCYGWLGFLTQFCLLSSLNWYFVLALNFYFSISNPFKRPQSNMPYYHLFAWGSAIFTGIMTSTNYGYRPELQLCWNAKSVTTVINIWNWLGYYVWLYVFSFASVFIFLHGYFKLKSTALQSTLSTRERSLKQTRTYVVIFTCYWALAGFLWASVYFKTAQSGTEIIQEQALSVTFALVCGLFGFVDFGAWLYTQWDDLQAVLAARRRKKERAKHLNEFDALLTPQSIVPKPSLFAALHGPKGPEGDDDPNTSIASVSMSIATPSVAVSLSAGGTHSRVEEDEEDDERIDNEGMHDISDALRYEFIMYTSLGIQMALIECNKESVQRNYLTRTFGNQSVYPTLPNLSGSTSNLGEHMSHQAFDFDGGAGVGAPTDIPGMGHHATFGFAPPLDHRRSTSSHYAPRSYDGRQPMSAGSAGSMSVGDASARAILYGQVNGVTTNTSTAPTTTGTELPTQTTTNSNSNDAGSNEVMTSTNPSVPQGISNLPYNQQMPQSTSLRAVFTQTSSGRLTLSDLPQEGSSGELGTAIPKTNTYSHAFMQDTHHFPESSSHPDGLGSYLPDGPAVPLRRVHSSSISLASSHLTGRPDGDVAFVIAHTPEILTLRIARREDDDTLANGSEEGITTTKLDGTGCRKLSDPLLSDIEDPGAGSQVHRPNISTHATVRHQPLHTTTSSIADIRTRAASAITTDHDHTGPGYWFFSYAPAVFQRLRYIFGITDEAHMASMAGDVIKMKKNFSEGASGSFFYFTPDKHYMVKTLTTEERDLLLKILPKYYKYMRDQPKSLICRFFGLYSIKMYNHKEHFVVMNNVLRMPAPDITIDETYDLKGSRINRHGAQIKGRGGERTPMTRRGMKPVRAGILKDNDLKKSVRISAQAAQELEDQLSRDALFLRENNIMDYSLLLGIHNVGLPKPRGLMSRQSIGPLDTDTTGIAAGMNHAAGAQIANVATGMRPGGEEGKQRNTSDATFTNVTTSITIPSSTSSLSSATTAFNASYTGTTPVVVGVAANNPGFAGIYQPTPSRPFATPLAVALPSDHSLNPYPVGVDADVIMGPGVYFMGVIDVLQEWTFAKRLEQWFKIVCKCHCRDWDEMSAVEPGLYAARFTRMIEGLFEPSDPSSGYYATTVTQTKPRSLKSNNKAKHK